MSDVSNRDELERRLARKIGKVQRAQMGKLLELLGDPPDLNNVTPDFWTLAGKELAAVLLPILEDIFLEQARVLLTAQPIGVDWALINRAAVDWARAYGFNLVTGVNATSQAGLQSAVSAYFEQGLTIGDLEKKLGNLFGPVRAEMIAVTEVTRASVEGERAIAGEIAKQGIDMIPIWQTNRDDLVCPICGPRHKKPIADGIFPPAHPRCRCWVNHELPEVAQ